MGDITLHNYREKFLTARSHTEKQVMSQFLHTTSDKVYDEFVEYYSDVWYNAKERCRPRSELIEWVKTYEAAAFLDAEEDAIHDMLQIVVKREMPRIKVMARRAAAAARATSYDAAQMAYRKVVGDNVASLERHIRRHCASFDGKRMMKKIRTEAAMAKLEYIAKKYRAGTVDERCISIYAFHRSLVIREKLLWWDLYSTL